MTDPATPTTGSHLETLVKRIVDAVHPLRIILFGSAARGEIGPDSDVNLLVVTPEGTERLHTMQFLHTQFHGLEVSVDVLVTTPAALERYRDNIGLIYRTILREGKELYVA
jgi:predicted nucleotidyltransferase